VLALSFISCSEAARSPLCSHLKEKEKRRTLAPPLAAAAGSDEERRRACSSTIRSRCQQSDGQWPRTPVPLASSLVLVARRGLRAYRFSKRLRVGGPGVPCVPAVIIRAGGWICVNLRDLRFVSWVGGGLCGSIDNPNQRSFPAFPAPLRFNTGGRGILRLFTDD
jgi:hypothetical protein